MARTRADDLDVNATKEKKPTNMRAASSDETVRLIPLRPLSLEQALELIRGRVRRGDAAEQPPARSAVGAEAADERRAKRAAASV